MTRTKTSKTRTSAAKTSRASAAAKKKSSHVAKVATAAPKAPLLDLRGILDKMKLPGVNVSGLIDSRRKDVAALLAANKQAYRGFEAVARRQREMLAEAMKGLRANAKETLATPGVSKRGAGIAEHVQEAFATALANMKEIAEMSARSQQEVVDTLKKRLRESIDEIGGRLKPTP
jgi:phasin family protein